ncbi:MAG TPA: pyrroline-5-carboxylate reductase dimerization domain-containing protein, partial [Candidatus Sulfotelmatobacter sp.]|nr:pyrroline-5-carboxylate reductase dimerization domain-containing protein [Candidatus Sulfotelmatobacter sp.]
PALVGHGMTALAKGPGPGTWSLAPAKKIFSAVGDVALVPEKWLDAVTGLSGSGPAYVYQMIEALTDGGVKVGLPKSLAARLALQTVLGAALTVKLTGKEPAELRSMVTSPGGTTIEGLNVLGKKGFNRAIKEAIAAAARKSKILSRQWAA